MSDEDEEAGSPLSSSSSIKEKTTGSDGDDGGDDDEDSAVVDDASSLPALFLLPPPAGADAPPGVAHRPPYSIRKAGVERTAEARVFVTAVASGEGGGGGGGVVAVDVSPWHDVPLRAAAAASSSSPSSAPVATSVNMVVEIPRGTSAKFEVATSEERTPIKQDKAKARNKAAAPVAPATAATGAVSSAAGPPAPAPAAAAAAASGGAAPPAILRHYALPISWNYGMLPRTFEVSCFCVMKLSRGEEEEERKNSSTLTRLSFSLSFLFRPLVNPAFLSLDFFLSPPPSA